MLRHDDNVRRYSHGEGVGEGGEEARECARDCGRATSNHLPRRRSSSMILGSAMCSRTARSSRSPSSASTAIRHVAVDSQWSRPRMTPEWNDSECQRSKDELEPSPAVRGCDGEAQQDEFSIVNGLVRARVNSRWNSIHGQLGDDRNLLQCHVGRGVGWTQ